MPLYFLYLINPIINKRELLKQAANRENWTRVGGKNYYSVIKFVDLPTRIYFLWNPQPVPIFESRMIVSPQLWHTNGLSKEIDGSIKRGVIEVSPTRFFSWSIWFVMPLFSLSRLVGAHILYICPTIPTLRPSPPPPTPEDTEHLRLLTRRGSDKVRVLSL